MDVETYALSKAYTDKKIKNLDISGEVAEQLPDAVADYCDEHYSEWSGALDDTLEQPNMAAPAKTVGDGFSSLKSALGRLGRQYSDTSLWIRYSINAATGGTASSTKYISTQSFIPKNITRITALSNAVFAVYAWNGNGTYVGCWDGTSYDTTNHFFTDIDLTNRTAFPTTYSIKIGCRSTPSGEIDTTFASNIVFHTETDNTLSIFGAAADANATGELISELTNKIEYIEDAGGIPLLESLELNYFEGSDLRVNKDNNSRGRTAVFQLKPGEYSVNINSQTYNYLLYGQTITGDTQTTTSITPSWTNAVTMLTENYDNYRVMIRRVDQGSMANDDLSVVKMVFTPSNNIDNTMNALETAILHPTVPVFPDKEDALKKAIQSEVDENTILFCISTDNHYNDFDWKDCLQTGFSQRMGVISKAIGADFIANLGDMIEGFNDNFTVENYKQQYVNNKRFIEMIRSFTDSGVPFLYTAGHHECYPISESESARNTLDSGTPFVQNRAFTSAEMKPMAYGKGILARLNPASSTGMGYRRHQGKIVDINDPNSSTSTLSATGASLTYYVDVSSTSGNVVRFLFVDSTHFTGQGYHPDTVTFVSNALVDAANNNYPVIILTHIPLRRGQYAMSDASDALNEAAFVSAIKNSGANILAYIHGHVHGDNIVTPETERPDTHTYPYADLDFPLVAISCQKIYGTSGPYMGDFVSYGTRNVTKYNAYCFDAVLVHTDTGRIDFFRFGAGDSGTYPTRSVNVT